MKIYDSQGTFLGVVQGIYEYDPNSYYTEGDLVILDDNSVLVCIKDIPSIPANNFIQDPQYFRPFWYFDAITSFSELASANLPAEAERPVLRRVLQAALEKHFGTGIILADRSLHGEEVDLNQILHTGRYIIYVQDIDAIKNFPYWLLSSGLYNNNNTQQLLISQVAGLDVYVWGVSNNAITGVREVVGATQVVFTNNSTKVSLAVRTYYVDNSNQGIWSDWIAIRTSYSIDLVNQYLNKHKNIVESLYDASRKQSFLIKGEYHLDNNDLVVSFPQQEAHGIFKQISGIMIFLYDNHRKMYANALLNIPRNLSSYQALVYRSAHTIQVHADRIVITNFAQNYEPKQVLFFT